MQRKIFIAINLDDKTKKYIEHKVLSLKQDLPVKWTSVSNYHITLQFMGYIEDEEIENIISRLKENLCETEVFDLAFTEIDYGPNSKKPKMVWLKGQKSDQLINLRQLVESAVSDANVKTMEFKPHITLGRLERGIKRQSLPVLNKAINLLVAAVSVDVMESVVEKGKRKYLLMESIELI